MLDSIEFAVGDGDSTWGSARAAMGHPEPFDIKYIAIGNEDCGKPNYKGMHMVLCKFFLPNPNGYILLAMPTDTHKVYIENLTN